MIEAIKDYTAVEILSVKCISPSSGLGDGSLLAAEFAGTVVGAVAGAGIAAVTGGTGSAAVPLGALFGGAAGAAGTYALDKYVAGDADDLFIRINDKKVWPSGDSKSIESQQTRKVGHTRASTNDQKIKLREYDSISGNDKLGSYTVRYGQKPGFYSALIGSSSEPESLYQLNLLVWDAPVTVTVPVSPQQVTEDVANAKKELIKEIREDVLSFLRPWL